MIEHVRKSILQPWVMRAPLRAQGTLLAGIRGADGLPKENDAKYVVRGIRQSVLVPADPRELERGGSYMSVTIGQLEEAANGFLENRDHYPMHFYLHVIHAIEVIGFDGPGEGENFDAPWNEFLRPAPAAWWKTYYGQLCGALHFNPETYEQYRARMLEDRIAKGA